MPSPKLVCAISWTWVLPRFLNIPVICFDLASKPLEFVQERIKNEFQGFYKALENKDGFSESEAEEVKQAILGYLVDCEKSGKRPANLGLYRALDMTKQDVSNVLTGKSKKKVSPECLVLLKKAIMMLSEYREQLGAQGKLNPVTLLFWQKNYDSLTDSQVIQLTSDRNERDNMTPDEVAKQIESDIPIDSECRVID